MYPRTDLSESVVINQTAWRFRVCGYLFNAGGLWIVLGFVVKTLGLWTGPQIGGIGGDILAVGFGIFSVAVALTLAIYRCPVCDRYISRFRPDKTKCAHCGARIRTAASK